MSEASESHARRSRRAAAAPDETHADDPGERVAKVIARAGLASRREAEALIAQGRVRVDGRVLESPGVRVQPNQVVLVDETPLPAADATLLWRYHKPVGLLVTQRDPQGRATVFDRLPPDMPRVVSVGRLDLNSEGLLLFTNDGGLARRLELPKTGWIRRYRVRAHGRPRPRDLETLAKGIVVDGERFGPIKATLERQTGANAWIAVSLTEGKNREVRRALESLGLRVNRLIRVSYGPFQLGGLKPGAVAAIPPKQAREQLGALLGSGR